MLLISFKALHGSGTGHVAELLLPFEPQRSLMSSGRTLPVVPTLQLKTKPLLKTYVLLIVHFQHVLPDLLLMLTFLIFNLLITRFCLAQSWNVLILV